MKKANSNKRKGTGKKDIFGGTTENEDSENEE